MAKKLSKNKCLMKHLNINNNNTTYKTTKKELVSSGCSNYDNGCGFQGGINYDYSWIYDIVHVINGVTYVSKLVVQKADLYDIKHTYYYCSSLLVS